MSPRDALLILCAGTIAGITNTIAGGGSLLTFPLLVALGLPRIDANVTNTVGIVPAAVGGMLGFRSELAEQRDRLVVLLPFAAVGAVGGAVLLLALPAHVFTRVVPVLLFVACGAVLAQRPLARFLADRGHSRSRFLRGGVLVTSIYGGYFGAGVSVIVLAILAISIDDSLKRLNALKLPFAGTMNLVSALVFAIVAPVHWLYVIVLAPATLAGGRIGATVARRVPEQPLRVVVVVLGITAAVWLQVSQ